MNKNVRWWERIFRYLIGVVLLAWAIAGGPWWAYLGIIPLATGALGFCPTYALFDRGTSNLGKKA